MWYARGATCTELADRAERRPFAHPAACLPKRPAVRETPHTAHGRSTVKCVRGRPAGGIAMDVIIVNAQSWLVSNWGSVIYVTCVLLGIGVIGLFAAGKFGEPTV